VAENRTEQAYAILKSRIMDGIYAPGQRLVIDQLRRDSDISTIPWRESLRRLEAEGWVEIVPHTGATVKKFDTDVWMKTVRLLARLEGLATSLAVGRMSAAEIADARKINEEMRNSLTNFDLHRYGVLDNAFHQLVCSHGDDARLWELLSSEWSRLELVRRGQFWYAPGRAVKSIEEHETLLDLIEGNADASVVESVAQRHKLNTLDAVAEHDRAVAAQSA
jgi:DNA-binding GntR family transcriptional regulator